MAELIAQTDVLRLALTTSERWCALRRTDLTIPWAQVSSVEAVAEPYRLVRGWRAPGLSLPGRARIGTWRHRGRKTFVVAHRGRPGLRISLQHNNYQQLLIDIDDPAGILVRLRERLLVDPTAAAEGAVSDKPISFRSGGVTLAGSLRLPGPVRAAALLISGSGRLDRDGNDKRAELRITLDIADSLAAAGIATLRYDKRGVGASGGDFLSAGFVDNIDDARAAVAALRSECPGVDLFVIGHGEGAMIATVLAGEPRIGLQGAVLLSAPAMTGEQTLLWQAAQIAPTLPEPVKFILRILRTDPLRQQRKVLDKLASTTTDVARIQGSRVNAKWFRELLVFDPLPHLRDVDIPVLAITGDKDLQVDPDDLGVIASTVPGPVTVNRVGDLTHILRRDPAAPTIGAYRKLVAQPVDSVVLQAISDWMELVAANRGIIVSSAES